MTATKASYGLIDLDEAAPGAAERGFGLGNEPGRGRVYLRRDFGILGFGVNAFHQERAGGTVIGEHDELGPGASGHEELYIVVNGSATFTIDGEDVDARQGTAIFVRPESKRKAVATDDGTTIVVVGGTPGEPFAVGAGEAMGDFFRHYRNKDYAAALADLLKARETHPDNATVLYNIGCIYSLLGAVNEALDCLEKAVARGLTQRGWYEHDSNLDAVRSHSRFQALLAIL